ncbi:hypothetical protein R4Z10_18010 [Niallia sp. XMNu-256]|uniref:DUF2680 domain-containing protein n=1 Tax=Niallia sp. XMNu-256 TaxID=3082444 RepID=UPI0030D13D8F
MKWNTILVAGALVGTFALGAMFSPIVQSDASVDERVGAPAMMRTATDENASQAWSNHHGSGHMMGDNGGMGMGHHFSGSMSTMIAEALNLSEEEIQIARSEGKSIADLAEEKDISLDELKAKVLEARKADLQQLVKDGDITQEQMDRMVVHMESMAAFALENNEFGHGHMNGRDGMGSGHHMNRGNMPF